jgi:nitronate monooxygenase
MPLRCRQRHARHLGVLPDFAAPCEAIIEVARLKARGIAWFCNATTVAEARAAEAAGADAVVAQGAEAGGHRGSFEDAAAEHTQVGLFALLPQVVDAVRIPSSLPAASWMGGASQRR